MSEEDKAKELVILYSTYSYGITYENMVNCAKECAKIAVDLLIKQLEEVDFNWDLESGHKTTLSDTVIPYWQRVKEKINDLKM